MMFKSRKVRKHKALHFLHLQRKEIKNILKKVKHGCKS